MTAPQDPFRGPDQDDAAASSRVVGSSGNDTSQPQYGQPDQPDRPSSQQQYGQPDQGQFGQAPPPPYGQGQQYGQQPQGAPYGQAPYGQPGYAQTSSPKNGFGIAALVLGILALLTGLIVVGGVFGIAAIIFGILGRGRAKRGEATNGGMALAGIITGVLGILLASFVLFGLFSFLGSESFSNLQDCLDSAGSDTAAQQACSDEFTNNITN